MCIFLLLKGGLAEVKWKHRHLYQFHCLTVNQVNKQLICSLKFIKSYSFTPILLISIVCSQMIPAVLTPNNPELKMSTYTSCSVLYILHVFFSKLTGNLLTWQGREKKKLFVGPVREFVFSCIILIYPKTSFVKCITNFVSAKTLVRKTYHK